MGDEPRGAAEPAKVEEEPTRRTAEHDPFELVDPDDPLGVAPEPKADPYAADDPAQDPTRNLARLIREAWRIRPRSGSRALALGF